MKGKINDAWPDAFCYQKAVDLRANIHVAKELLEYRRKIFFFKVFLKLALS